MRGSALVAPSVVAQAGQCNDEADDRDGVVTELLADRLHHATIRTVQEHMRAIRADR